MPAEDDSSTTTENQHSTSTETDADKTNSSNSSSSFSLARSETLRVHRSKIVLLTVLLLSAAFLGTLVYFIVDREEQVAFRNSFENYATEVSDLVHYEADNIFSSVQLVSTAITSLANSTNATWPNMTMPHFEIRGAKNNKLSKALQLSFVPLIPVEHREGWEAYVKENGDWLAESLTFQEEFKIDENDFRRQRRVASETQPAALEIPSQIWRYQDGESGEAVPQTGLGVDFGPGAYAPIWQQSPAPSDPSIINFDLLSHPVFKRVYHGMWETRLPVLSEAMDLTFIYGAAVKDDAEHPHSFLLSPIYTHFSAKLHDRDDLAGFLVAIMAWDTYFTNLLVEGTNGIVVVLEDTCDDHFTYQINGPEAVFMGEGDLHDTKYDDFEFYTDFAPFLQHNFSDTHEHCEYFLRIFPSAQLEAKYRTSNPGIYTAVVLAVFLVTALAFIMYDRLVQARQNKVMATAKRTNAIVSSLFPSNVRDRMMQEIAEEVENEVNAKGSMFGKIHNKTKLKAFLEDENDADHTPKAFDSKPIADLFPNVTVMFADIVGFTAWSSVREPSQVFTLLETLFAAFDEIATRRRVFKVETVGDCYVAVAGLPDPRRDHATVMARFARDVLYKMNDLTKRLEVVLGPDTGDLSLRIGLHSGQVTAGVLRGDKSRFQLFGDTMNTAARIESTGERNRIHVSVETASLLMMAGKSHWVKERQDEVHAKGKGELKTYWLDLRPQSAASVHSGSDTNASDENEEERPAPSLAALSGETLSSNDAASMKKALDEKTGRLIEWNVDVLARLLKQIESRRRTAKTSKGDTSAEIMHEGLIIDEVKEIIELPHTEKGCASAEDHEKIELDKCVIEQLRGYVSNVAALYRDNPFHNFEHASHVTMSVTKLLSRIVAPEIEYEGEDAEIAARLHDHTFGITSDPLTQFACVFSALVHDLDHPGVPNSQLIKEQTAVAAAYGNKSVAEQNSVDIAWELLLDSEYQDLRDAIYCNMDEKRRFRQLLVNSLMATDIMDKDANSFRKARWAKAFDESSNCEDSKLDSINRKATIVIEHLIQASDVSHTMQHWHIYQKWNERLFEELYKAYKQGRSETDPSANWYKGEIGFLDFYVIPLAKKLKQCGVFGVSSDEYLNYAEKNRREWELRGQERVAAMLNKCKDIYG